MHMQRCKFIDFCTFACAFYGFYQFSIAKNKITGSING
jgi:hypothetical protein